MNIRKKKRKRSLYNIRKKLIKKDKERYLDNKRKIDDLNKRLENWDYGR